MQDVVLHHHGSYNDKYDDQRIKHGSGTHLVEIVLAEQGEVDGEAGNEDKHQQNLSHNGQTDPCVSFLASLHFFLVRL